ncbi:DUF2264 domain-containing protein [Gorillibacterium sp. sgz5001074]|uniref:DUF2264 domain-containing protein n=1 Tax=Gorillibacterium sp. sgz5001074 TaxID=3446695 RepID=UPI003F671B0E
MTIFDLPIRHNPLKTKEDLQEAVRQLCRPLEPHFSEGKAWLTLGSSAAQYEEVSALVEAFARPLWGLVPLSAGGGESTLWDTYAEGIRNGTNPEHPEYWGVTDVYDQRFVEMAALGLALCLAPEKVWSPLTEDEKKRFRTWLDQINHYDMPPNNWRFFIVFVNTGLERVGAEFDAGSRERALELLDTFYVGDGWYSDGKTDQLDYYIPFAMHFYSLIYAKLMEHRDPERSARYKERARLFAQDFIHWFAEDGTALPYGRSLTYRFAMSALWGALAYADVEVFSWGVMKGLLLRNLRWWFQKNIFTSDGLLTIGYAYSNLHMSEGYNAPGSPYWAMKAFLPLALADGHPFWTAEEEELPARAEVSVQTHARMILTKEPGHVVALTSGQTAGFRPMHYGAKYAKFAYSSAFGFSITKSNLNLVQGAFDSMLALSEDGSYYRTRHECEEYRVESGSLYSRWKPWKNVQVETWLLPAGMWHVRLHRIVSERELHTAEGGFALKRVGLEKLSVKDGITQDENGVMAHYPWGTSGIVNLFADGSLTPELINVEPNTNLIHPQTAIPTLKGLLQPGTHWLASAVLGSIAPEAPVSLWPKPPVLTVSPEELRVEHGGLIWSVSR